MMKRCSTSVQHMCPVPTILIYLSCCACAATRRCTARGLWQRSLVTRRCSTSGGRRWRAWLAASGCVKMLMCHTYTAESQIWQQFPQSGLEQVCLQPVAAGGGGHSRPHPDEDHHHDSGSAMTAHLRRSGHPSSVAHAAERHPSKTMNTGSAPDAVRRCAWLLP